MPLFEKTSSASHDKNARSQYDMIAAAFMRGTRRLENGLAKNASIVNQNNMQHNRDGKEIS